ncbi:quinolinate phosphoribosyltransferase [decarboxylating] 2b, mitochondrial-like isoform X3 [Prosopis cineraria]|uniref:quinolinate phosphoribosyltransferase [decarboxylating] 2b, mitochondrial-like isoform X3 n=1 Tax=Prosopis cineraria TaxID=364024 RepID=UPI00240FCCE7|nr:quinolinate phosphoribosyltransferase [decarboxylating] 2b, mitochondrial-like isoform X3 [Prosopis cineraria]
MTFSFAVSSSRLLLSSIPVVPRRHKTPFPPSFSPNFPGQSKIRKVVKMSATDIASSTISSKSFAIKPPIHPTYDLKNIIKSALAEDAGDQGDVTCLATIPFDMEVDAYFLAKEDGIIAGIALAEMIFHEVDPSLRVEWSQNDGDYIHKGLQFGKVHGRAHNIVVAERVVLNFMQRMSGIATLTKMQHTQHISWRPEKLLQVYDYWTSGRSESLPYIYRSSLAEARVVLRYLCFSQVETRTLEEVKEALHYASQTKTSLTRIMLDNMVVPLANGDVDISMLKEAVELVNGRFETEASGNVTIETVHQIGQSGVTYISRMCLCCCLPSIGIQMKSYIFSRVFFFLGNSTTVFPKKKRN